jgi:hypothetical protein
LGKGAQDTWRFARQWGGRLDKTGVTPMLAGRRGKLGTEGAYTTQRFNVSHLERPTEESRGFKPDPGNLAVRD